jgi:hypothetical protein
MSVAEQIDVIISEPKIDGGAEGYERSFLDVDRACPLWLRKRGLIGSREQTPGEAAPRANEQPATIEYEYERSQKGTGGLLTHNGFSTARCNPAVKICLLTLDGFSQPELVY